MQESVAVAHPATGALVNFALEISWLTGFGDCGVEGMLLTFAMSLACLFGCSLFTLYDALTMFRNDRRRTFHDRMASTLVLEKGNRGP